MGRWGRIAAGIATLGGSEIANSLAGDRYGDQQRQRRQNQLQGTLSAQDEFLNRGWDPNTFMPGGRAPTAEQAIQGDWRSQQLYLEAKNRYFQDALGSNQQALSTLGGYRAGGAAGAAANLLQNRGAMQLDIANSLERPDFFAEKRDAESRQARKEAKQASQMAMLGGALGAAGTILGGLAGGGGAGAAGAGAQVLGAGLGSPGAQPAGFNPIGAGDNALAAGGARSGAGSAQAGVQQPGGAEGAPSMLGQQSPGGMGGGAEGAPQGAQQVAQAAPLQSASLQIAASTVDRDWLNRQHMNLDYISGQIPGATRPDALYSRIV